MAHWSVLALLVERLGAAPAPASGAGALVGAAVGYAGNRMLTFRGTTAPHWVALPRFLMVAGMGALANAAIVQLGTTWGWHYLAAQTLATLLVLLGGYGANRQWTFR